MNQQVCTTVLKKYKITFKQATMCILITLIFSWKLPTGTKQMPTTNVRGRRLRLQPVLYCSSNIYCFRPGRSSTRRSSGGSNERLLNSDQPSPGGQSLPDNSRFHVETLFQIHDFLRGKRSDLSQKKTVQKCNILSLSPIPFSDCCKGV